MSLIERKAHLPKALLPATLAFLVFAGAACDINPNPTKIPDSKTPITGTIVPENRVTVEKANLMERLKLSEEQYENLKKQATDKIDNELKILTANERASDIISMGKNYDSTKDSDIVYKWRSLKTALSVDPRLPVPILLDSIGMPVIDPETGKAMLVNSPEATTYIKYLEQRYVDPSSYVITNAQILATGRRSNPSDAPKAEDILTNPETGKPISAWFSPDAVEALEKVLLTKTMRELVAQAPTAQR